MITEEKIPVTVLLLYNSEGSGAVTIRHFAATTGINCAHYFPSAQHMVITSFMKMIKGFNWRMINILNRRDNILHEDNGNSYIVNIFLKDYSN